MGTRSWLSRPFVGLVSVVVIGGAVAAGMVAAERLTPDFGVADLAQLAPANVSSIDVTNWSALRDRLGAGGDDVVEQAATRDLATRSTLVSSGDVVADGLGWSPRTVRWEAFVQTTAGSALFLGLPESRDVTSERMRDLGYVQDGDEWTIELSDLRAGGVSTPETFQHARLLDGGVVVASSELEVVERLGDVAEGRSPSLADDPTALRAWAQAVDLDAFSLQSGSAGCASTDPAESGPDIAAQAAVAVEAAGTLEPYRWLVRGLGAGEQDPTEPGTGDSGDRFEVALAFDSAPVAAGQAEVRARLATGPFIGQTGTVEESIVLTRHRVDGDVAVLEFDRQAGAASLMSFIGPLVLASC
ncbi:hypothetical protein [Aeromicrobium sp. Sec7.5]|uniref:hypothetical protein n=1 Tax=Aeromicrobium sp. Sec7.5 TaxID=3121276 RepID=UPI002FE448C5